MVRAGSRTSRAGLRGLALLLAGLVLMAGCTGRKAPNTTPVDANPPEPQAVEARIVAVGDLLMHLPLVYSSELPDGGWDFKPLFEPVAPLIQKADFAVANLETTLTGSDYPWSGYPGFNTPPEFARDVKAVGFDAVTHANNHALDYDEPGLIKTIEALERYGIPRTGTNRTPDEQEQILVVEVVPGIKMALLSYTYGTNGIPLPNPWNVNMLDPDRIRADIRQAREMPEVDLVAVALHMGEEYAREPNEEQEFYVQLSLEAGADIILGDHPHVVQKIEVRQVTDEFGRDLPRAVIFSLGNFISNQVGLDRLEGLMFVVDVRKEDGVTRVEKVSFIPTYVHTYYTQDGERYRVVSLEQAMRDYEQGTDPLITAADYQLFQEAWADTTERAIGCPEVTVLHLADW